MDPLEQPKEKNSALVETLQAVVISLIITTIVYVFIAMPNQVISISMMPTFKDGELVITNKLFNWLEGSQVGDSLDIHYSPGDVIVFQKPGDSDLIKRIIAKEGDKIMLKEGRVIVNGNELKETYLDPKVETRGASFLGEGEEITVPEDQYFVMGDNRSKSLDSRYLDVGFVNRRDIKGKVVWRYWPLERFGQIKAGEIVSVSLPTNIE